MGDDTAPEAVPVQGPSPWRRYLPLLILIFLAPATGELLSGSSPPASWITIFGIINIVLYGFGAVLAREYSKLWGGGWHRVLLLGAAYGIVEEGLVCKSFFDTKWPDLGPLATYGRYLGTGWVWSLNLTIFHMFISIAIPILIVELMFPSVRAVNWTNRPGRITILLLFIANAILTPVIFQPYRAIPQLTIATIVVLLLALLAWRWKGPQLPTLPDVRLLRPITMGLLGFACTFFFLIVQYVIPKTALPPIADMALTAGVAFLVGRFLYFRTGAGRVWTDRHRVALVTGALVPFMMLAPLVELGNHPSNGKHYTGQSLVGLAFLIGLIFLRRAILRRQAPTEVQGT
jgi:hypothetical protein